MTERSVRGSVLSNNQQWWDERARLHGADLVYDVSAFLAGRSTLYELDHAVTGSVTGQDVIHLQCHTGMDTLSWLRAGARRVAGVDFSPVAIDKATALAQSAGLADHAQFYVADILDLPVHLRAAFDVCYASRGVLCWIDDLDEWMRQARAVLKPSGRLVLIDMHPLFLMADSVDPLVLDFPYAADGPQRFENQAGSYAAPEAATEHNSTTEYAHSLAEIVTAAIESDLTIDHLGEHLAVETDGPRGLATREDDGLMRWRHTGQPLPIMFSLRALPS
ncbi:MAG: class I SAM-dependent methyltransferase [Humibacillus sp.]|nr:class I SAM-dependent methyltransferase [Humibacillus sp.]MDN5775742.1 class I SAM-dependent methyltransferase [Humibacillus sp.]